jgi:hypothetical protein
MNGRNAKAPEDWRTPRGFATWAAFSGVAAAWKEDALFPLTPALSLGEREKLWPFMEVFTCVGSVRRKGGTVVELFGE